MYRILFAKASQMCPEI